MRPSASTASCMEEGSRSRKAAAKSKLGPREELSHTLSRNAPDPRKIRIRLAAQEEKEEGHTVRSAGALLWYLYGVAVARAITVVHESSAGFR